MANWGDGVSASCAVDPLSVSAGNGWRNVLSVFAVGISIYRSIRHGPSS